MQLGKRGGRRRMLLLVVQGMVLVWFGNAQHQSSKRLSGESVLDAALDNSKRQVHYALCHVFILNVPSL